MTLSERDSLQSITNIEIKKRIQLADCIINDGIKEGVGASRLKEVIRQQTVLISVLKDRDRKKVQKPEGIIVKLKPLALTVKRT